MKKVNHITWSFGISLWIYYFGFGFNLFETVILAFFTGIFAFLSDVDIRIVNWSKKMMYKSFFLLFPIYLFCKILFKHRTITHTLWIPLLFFFVYFKLDLYWFFEVVLLILGMAVSLHIFEDSLTVSGVEPFYPLPLKVRLWSFSTGSTFDFIVLESISFFIVCSFIITWFFDFV